MQQSYPGKLIYSNPLCEPKDIESFILEGQAQIGFRDGAMALENALSGSLGQKANYVLWCPQQFPSNLRVQWEFKPLSSVGLCMLFFAARGRGGKDLFDPSLPVRTGEYPQYHSGQIDAFHVSYYRRKEPDERAFHTCNLRKSHGFHLVAQGADPLPDAADAEGFYRICVTKCGSHIGFAINDLTVFDYQDDGVTFGPHLGAGRIGFRQLAPLTALYRGLKVYDLSR